MKARPPIRSPFSLVVADRIKAGASVSDAIHDVLGGIRDGSGPRTSTVLADLADMGLTASDFVPNTDPE